MVALEMLGFAPCYHMRNVLTDLENELPHWERVNDEGFRDWDAIFGDSQSTVDWPSARFYADLMEHYPDAKVILSVRSPEGWVKSMRETVWGVYFGDTVLRHVSDARGVIDPWWKRFLELMNRMNWEPGASMAGDYETDEGFAEIMHRWNETVKSTVPAERLLVWDPKEGWDPLCEFLEVDVPDTPLPNLNDAASFKEGIIGGGLQMLNEWWDQRERPETGLHGAAIQQ
jgi:Sulfotransferase domain